MANERELDAIVNIRLKSHCASENPLKDLVFFSISHCARRSLPYGQWTCEDGREVLFNREYQPILEIRDGVRAYCDHNEWVGKHSPIVKTQYFYDDLTSPVRLLTKHLAIPYMFKAPPNKKDTQACRKSLLICLQKLKEFTPEESGSVSHTYSALQL